MPYRRLPKPECLITKVRRMNWKCSNRKNRKNVMPCYLFRTIGIQKNRTNLLTNFPKKTKATVMVVALEIREDMGAILHCTAIKICRVHWGLFIKRKIRKPKNSADSWT